MSPGAFQPLPGGRYPDPATRQAHHRLGPSYLDITTDEAIQRFPELAALGEAGWEWTHLHPIDLLVGYRACPDGMCTLYLHDRDTATVWIPTADGPRYRHGSIAGIVDTIRKTID